MYIAYQQSGLNLKSVHVRPLVTTPLIEDADVSPQSLRTGAQDDALDIGFLEHRLPGLQWPIVEEFDNETSWKGKI